MVLHVQEAIYATIIYWCVYLSIEERKKSLVIKAHEYIVAFHWKNKRSNSLNVYRRI